MGRRRFLPFYNCTLAVCRALNYSDPKKLDAALKKPIENILKFILDDELHQIDAYSVEERMPFVRHLNEVQRIISSQSRHDVPVQDALALIVKALGNRSAECTRVSHKTADPGLSDAKENPRPLLLAPLKRFGLLGCSSYQPAEWPQLGGTPALLPPAIHVKPVQHQWGAKKTLRMLKSCNHHHTLCHLREIKNLRRLFL